MRIFSLLLVVFSFLFLTGCGKDSTLDVKIKEVDWKAEANRSSGFDYKTNIVIDDGRKLTFDGIHDFKVGACYKITVKEGNAALVKFECKSPPKKEEVAAQTFKPTTTTSDKIIFKVVVDKSGNILASEEVGPEVKTVAKTETKTDTAKK